jgi:anthranilate phosphoribosyltransferase
MLLGILEQLYQQQDLNQAQAYQVFSEVINGQVPDVILASLLTALKMKGEKPQEIAGAAQAMIKNASVFPYPDYEFADIVGTGGDGHNTINISSAAAIVAASCGVKVAKHGNRSVSSQSGSADLFKAFGLDLNMSADIAKRCLDQANLCFLFAPHYHAGIKHSMPVRTTLKTRTIFNLLGPLANPARPSHIIVGVYSPTLLMPFAKTLQLLGYKNAMVVHGSGLDEFALHGDTQVAQIKGDKIEEYLLSPHDFGLKSYPLEAIKGGQPDDNKRLIEKVINGQGEKAHQAAVAMNAGALLTLCGKADSFLEGASMAVRAMEQKLPALTIKLAAELSQQSSH